MGRGIASSPKAGFALPHGEASAGRFWLPADTVALRNVSSDAVDAQRAATYNRARVGAPPALWRGLIR